MFAVVLKQNSTIPFDSPVIPKLAKLMNVNELDVKIIVNKGVGIFYENINEDLCRNISKLLTDNNYPTIVVDSKSIFSFSNPKRIKTVSIDKDEIKLDVFGEIMPISFKLNNVEFFNYGRIPPEEMQAFLDMEFVKKMPPLTRINEKDLKDEVVKCFANKKLLTKIPAPKLSNTEKIDPNEVAELCKKRNIFIADIIINKIHYRFSPDYSSFVSTNTLRFENFTEENFKTLIEYLSKHIDNENMPSDLNQNIEDFHCYNFLNKKKYQSYNEWSFMINKINKNKKKCKLAVLLSGSGRTLENLFDKIDEGYLDANIVVVVSSNPDAFGLERAKKRNVSNFTVNKKDFPNAVDFGNAITEILEKYEPDIVVLAGFIHLYLVPNKYKGKVINIHPALLPKFGGKGMYTNRVHKAVLDAGEKFSGATVHFVTNEYDKGPIILQKKVQIEADDTPSTLASKVFEKECEAYPEAIKMLIDGDVKAPDILD